MGYRYYGCQEDRATISFWLWIELYHFEYTDISADKKEINERDTVTVKAKVKNTGNMTGKEIVQLYVRDIEHSVIRPEKELKEFCKVELAPGRRQPLSLYWIKGLLLITMPILKIGM